SGCVGGLMQGYQKPKFKIDDTGVLKKYGDRCIAEDFKMLKYLKINYVWRDPPKYDQKKNMVVSGEVRRCPNMDRDVYGVDILVIIAKRRWREMSKLEKWKLIWHELRHVQVYVDDTMRPEVDDHDRIKIHLNLHDMDLGRFQDELTKFGANAEERV